MESSEQHGDDDKVLVYGAMRESSSFGPEKCRNLEPAVLPTVYSDEELQSERTGSQGDCAELLNPSVVRPRADSPSNWSDNFSIIAKTGAQTFSCWKHPKVRENWKVVLGSVLLFVVGLFLLIIGVIVEITGTTGIHSFVSFIAGLMCFIPGAYHVVYIYCAVKGMRGFTFQGLSIFR